MKLSHWEPDLRTLFNWIDNREIDLQPNFQRGDVWPVSKKRKLIDTILREWSIPPIHVVVTSSGTLDVLDGQQRLTAIRDFMNDDFSIDGSIKPSDQRVEELSGLRYSQLPPPVRRAFDQYTLRVFRITDYRPEEPGELFYRLNQQITLTAGEQRNAIYGPAREQLKRLVSKFEEAGNKRDTIGFSNSRLAYDDVFAKILFFNEHCTFAEKASEDRISDRFKLQKPFPVEAVDRSYRAIHLFSASRERTKKLKLNKASLLSWLLFFCRLDTRNMSFDYMNVFETAKAGNLERIRLSKNSSWEIQFSQPTRFEEGLFNLFVDRSSLRVSDVSSVVYRDFALWAVFHSRKFGEIPESIDVKQIRRISKEFDDEDEPRLEFILDDSLDIKNWARI